MREIREVLRLWLWEESDRAIARLSLVDRKTVDRYVAAGGGLRAGPHWRRVSADRRAGRAGE